MRGELIGVWAETWRQIWLPLIEQPLADDDEGLPEDIFCELYRVLALALSPRPSVEDLADIIDNPVQSREAFEATSANDLVGERALAGYLHLDQLMKEYEDAVRDLRFGCTGGRIKMCIGKQFMLLEAIGALDPGETKNTLGDICDQLNSWPHATIKEALKKLYGFASDYPGIRHGGTPESALRAVDMRDMVAMSILLVGFTPYLAHGLNPDVVYRGT